jgi:hypothetical protein
VDPPPLSGRPTSGPVIGLLRPSPVHEGNYGSPGHDPRILRSSFLGKRGLQFTDASFRGEIGGRRPTVENPESRGHAHINAKLDSGFALRAPGMTSYLIDFVASMPAPVTP